MPNQVYATPDMEREGLSSTTLRPQPKNPDNGCCFQFCGKAPGPVDVKKILAAGGRWVQLEDGRIVEYYVYGSEKADARVLLQCNGTYATGWGLANYPLVNAKLKELNIKGISITVPGHGYSSMRGDGFKIGQWPKDDVEPVLAKEAVTRKFMVEGTSYGTSHAMALGAHFGDRVSALHLHVPYIPMELREELGFQVKTSDDTFADKDAAWVNSCGSCCCHCCLDCCACRCLMGCCPGAMDDENTAKAETAAPGSSKITVQDLRRSFAGAGSYGLLHNSTGMICKDWGFSPRDSASPQTKVMISYNDGDQQCPPEHARFLIEHFTEKAAAVTVNNAPNETKKQGNNHGGQMSKMVNGEFVQLLADFDSS